MEIFRSNIYSKTTNKTDVIDITPQISEVVRNSGIKDGILFLFVSGSTAALTTIEYENGIIRNFLKILGQIVPNTIRDQHKQRWEQAGNGNSHVSASLFGPSLHIPLTNKKLLIGPWQQIVLLDFDRHARNRDVVIQIIGTQ